MKQKKNIKLLYVLLLSLILSACARVDLLDAEWCGDMGEDGATCFKTFSDGSRDIPKEQWDRERFGMVCSQPANFADLKKAILKLCKVSKRCTLQDKKDIKNFFQKVADIEVQAQ